MSGGEIREFRAPVRQSGFASTVELFNLLDNAADAVKLVHDVLDFIIGYMQVDVACYYRASGTFADQIFMESASPEPAHSLDLIEELYLGARRAYRASQELDDPDLITEEQYISLAVGDGLFLLVDRDQVRVEPREQNGTAEFLHIAGRVVEIALRFAQAEAQSMQDALTGLFNRRFFDDILPREIERAERYETEFSLVMADVDGFKAYNDSKGHRAGDLLLQQLGRTLRESLRRIDIAIRYGGDEFALILPHTPSDHVWNLIDRLQGRVTELCERTASDVPIGISFGVASYPHDASSAEALFEIADSRLYKVKQTKKTALNGPRLTPAELEALSDTQRGEHKNDGGKKGRDLRKSQTQIKSDRESDAEVEGDSNSHHPFGRRPFGRP